LVVELSSISVMLLVNSPAPPHGDTALPNVVRSMRSVYSQVVPPRSRR
jgi:hypothetical protein